jgi:hypothetical protein
MIYLVDGDNISIYFFIFVSSFKGIERKRIRKEREARTGHMIASIDLRNPVATRCQLSCFFKQLL